MTADEVQIFDEIKADHGYVVDLRRHFHKHPEIAKEEFQTALKIEEELDKIGLAHQRVAETGLYAEIKGEKDASASGASAKTIVLRADIDALPIQETHICEYTSEIPGCMHACGHDAHTAALLGAARILNKHKDLFSGTVRLTFQSGEEIGYGARKFVDGGYLDGADRTFGMHAASPLSAGKVAVVPGPNNASVDWFKITVKGHPAHVSTPQLGADAAYIASQIVISTQAIITRRTSPMDNVLVGIGKITAGDAYNIVAQKAELEGTIRAFTPEVRENTKKMLKEISERTAETFGGTAEIEYKDFTSPLINDDEATVEIQKTAEKIFGSENVIKSRQPSLGGDDFAEYIIKVPGTYAYFGTGNPAKEGTTAAHHDSKFDIDEDALIQAVALYTFYAIDFLK
ncbi:MAG: amidohydrolase [Treponema sp.]|nr:amidohydrolase [Treponema sp.]